DPIGSGFVAGLARPSGNITGFMLFESSVTGKWLAMLREIAPDLARDAALLDNNLRGEPVDEIAAALTRRKVPFLFVTGYGSENLPRAFGKVALVAKPFSQQQLVEAAAQLVDQRGDIVRLKK